MDPKIEDYHQPPVEERKLVKVDQSIKTRRHYSRPSSNISSNDLTKYDVGSMTPEEIQRKTGELYERKDGVWRCLECEYTTSINSSTMKKHVETHLQGLSYTCSICSKDFRSKSNFYLHKSKCSSF